MSANVFVEQKRPRRFKWRYPITGLVFAFIVYLSLKCTYSSPTGSFHFKTIHGEASIIYEDSYGVPYISGTTNQAIAFAMGFVHAADRLYDLALRRSMASGKISELFGKDALGFDQYMRSLQFSNIVDRELLALSPENKTFLQAYADGINEYVGQLKVDPIEFLPLGITFEPWTVKDSLMILKHLSFSLSGHWQLTILRSGIASKWGKELAERLVPFEDTKGFFEQVTVINPEDIETKRVEEKPKEVREPRTAKEEPEKKVEDTGIKYKVLKGTQPEPGKASNSWVIHGSRTKSKKPLLANDPHADHRVPSELFIASMKYPTNGPTVVGATVAGLPFVLFGRNEHLAWGITTSFIENVDLYSIRLSSDKKQYYHDGKWKNLTCSTEIIKVKGGEAVEYTVYKTHHGPIMAYPLSQSLGQMFEYFYIRR